MTGGRGAGWLPSGTAMERFRRARGQAPSPDTMWLEAVQTQILLEDGPLEMIPIAWEVASLAPPTFRRSVHLLALWALVRLTEGSTCVDVEASSKDGARLSRLTPEGHLETLRRAREVLQDPAKASPAVSADPLHPAPLVVWKKTLQLERLAWLEARLARHLQALCARPVRRPPALTSGAGARLTDEQRAAVRAAATRALAVITGGPGTGKTTIVRSIVRGLVEQGMPAESIALVAPTGKAAHRLGEALRVADGDGARVHTVHRLLGAREDGAHFAHHQGQPVPYRVVVCDEASMLDIELAARVVDALPGDGRLVLVGDADQLPSVDAGSVLSHLVEGLGEPWVHRLTHNFRSRSEDPSGRSVAAAAAALHRGRWPGFRPDPGSTAGAHFRPVHDEAERAEFLKDHLKAGPLGDPVYRRAAFRTRYEERARFTPADEEEIRKLLAQLGRRQLLTVTRQAPFRHGALAVSRDLHHLYALWAGVSAETEFLPGEPVMMLRNDYPRRLFNGDLGMVVSVAQAGQRARAMVAFDVDGTLEAFDLAPLRTHLSWAHAMTVHKAQGSEYDHVGLLLPEEDIALMTREVLYTAVTRARRSALVAGQRSIFERALNRRVERGSSLLSRLTSEPEPQLSLLP